MSEPVVPHPRESASQCRGHDRAEAQLFQAAKSGRMPHAWLFHGPQGIGKATLAYRFATFILAGGVESAQEGGGLFGDGPTDLSITPDSPTARRVLACSHADLKVLESSHAGRTTKRQEINVDEAREAVHFLAHTPSESAWRVLILDSVDAINSNAANALLKVIEEPPPQTVVILIAHQLGRVLPTIRSRCRQLALSTPDAASFDAILARVAPEIDAETRTLYRQLSDAAPGHALHLHAMDAAGVYQKIITALQQPDGREGPRALLQLAEKMAVSGEESEQWALFSLLMTRVVFACSRVLAGDADATAAMLPFEAAALPAMAARKPLDSWLSLWDNVKQSLADTDRLNLDRKQTALQLLQSIAA